MSVGSAVILPWESRWNGITMSGTFFLRQTLMDFTNDDNVREIMAAVNAKINSVSKEQNLRTFTPIFKVVRGNRQGEYVLMVYKCSSDEQKLFCLTLQFAQLSHDGLVVVATNPGNYVNDPSLDIYLMLSETANTVYATSIEAVRTILLWPRFRTIMDKSSEEHREWVNNYLATHKPPSTPHRYAVVEKGDSLVIKCLAHEVVDDCCVA